MSLTTSEIAILVAPLASTCAALIMGAAVYLGVMRRRRKLLPRERVVVEQTPGETALTKMPRPQTLPP